MAFRIDQGGTFVPERLPNGFLRVDASISRAGIFVYRNPDGTMRRELRPPEEVFDSESLRSFATVPVTDLHPPKMLDATSARDFTRGVTSDARKDDDGEHVATRMTVMDAELIAKLDDGTARETSSGYTCELDETPGEHPKYGKYDAVQRKIRGNHVAIVPRGRAGSSRVRMDEASVAMVRSDGNDGDGNGSGGETPDNSQNRKAPQPMKIRIDGVDYDTSSEAFAQAFARNAEKTAADLKSRADEIAALTKQKSELQAKYDAQAEKLVKLETEVKEAPKKVLAEMKARASLETDARKVLGAKFKLDGLDDKSVRLEVLKRTSPSAKFDGKDDAYIAARFDAAIETYDAEDAPAAPRNLEPEETDRADDVGVDDTDTEQRVDSLDARAKMLKANNSAWQSTLKAHTKADDNDEDAED